MTSDQWFWLITSAGLYFSALLLLDAAHKAHQAELRRAHHAELDGMRTYIRTLNRERKYLEAQLAKYKQAMAARHDNAFDPFANSSVDPTPVKWLPPSEEYDERE